MNTFGDLIIMYILWYWYRIVTFIFLKLPSFMRIKDKKYGKLYQELKITSKDIKSLTKEEIKNGEQGLIYLPYIMKEQTGSSDEYVEFMKAYNKAHECCPKCGTKPHSTTLVAYIIDMDNKDTYKDKNKCHCLSCGDIHAVHDRVSDEIVDETIDTLPF